MENASKALLIAAAVSIAIVLIALGVKLLSSTNATTQSADEVGLQLSDKTDEITTALKEGLLSIEEIKAMQDETFNQFIVRNYFRVCTGKEVLEMCDLIEAKYGNLHGGRDTAHITSAGVINCNNIRSEIKLEKNYLVSNANKKTKEEIYDFYGPTHPNYPTVWKYLSIYVFSEW